MNASIEWHVIGQHANGTIRTEIKQTLPTGWHTYWKNPGDSGEKAKIRLISSRISVGELIFPKPTMIPVDPFITYGYKNKVTYQLPLSLNAPIDTIEARFEWLECNDVCIPKEQIISLAIPKKIPIIKRQASLTPPFTLEKKGKKIQFIFESQPSSAEFYPYKNNQFNLKKMALKKNTLTVPLLERTIDTIEGELFINDGEGLPINTKTQPSNTRYFTPIVLVFSAFIGGLLLNIMPCVLPILGIKAIQLTQSSNQRNIQDAWGYFIGITISLLGLYGTLLGLKMSGASIGWGFQLQSPQMIQGLILLFIAIMATNLDLIHIPLPKFASQKSNNMIFNGILTTIIATPCTAPFLGTALSAALFQSPIIGLAIFLAMSLGLALPMVLIIIMPTARRVLPSSGQWNQSIKYYLNMGFVLTIGWFMWVLSAQVNTSTLLAFFSGVIALFSLLILKSNQPSKKAIVMLLFTATIGLLPVLLSPTSTAQWAPYTPELRQQLESNNSPYLIDITAKWCITCQTNKITVLNKKETLNLFASKNIALIQADWTTKSDIISKLLAEFNQISIPTYIYYDGSKHIVFGDILTQKKLKSQLGPSL
jgi:thiol:disulfide interchange protein DsbD